MSTIVRELQGTAFSNEMFERSASSPVRNTNVDCYERRIATRWLDDNSIDWSEEDQGLLPTWDGKKLRLGKVTTFNVFHEIAHRMIAPPAYQHLGNYGDGPDTEAGDELVSGITNSVFADEMAASALGIVLWSTVTDEPWFWGADDHGWLIYTTDGDDPQKWVSVIDADFWVQYRNVASRAQRWVRWLGTVADATHRADINLSDA